jgi:hypothetical protein
MDRAMSDSIPQDMRYTDLTPAQLAFLQQTVPLDARRNGLIATIEASPPVNGLLTVTVHFGRAPAPVPLAPVAQPPAADPLAPARTPAPVAAPPPDIDFTSGGMPLTAADIADACAALDGIEPALVWAIIKKECQPLAGFLHDRRPLILYERHVFAELTNHRFDNDNAEISGPRYTRYGTYADQYARLAQAMRLEPEAALRSCSWGVGQLLGRHAEDLGYANAREMVADMVASEGAQLRAMVTFLRNNRLIAPLKAKAWDDFATAYNGGGNPDYARQLEQDYLFYAASGPPDPEIRAAQLCLAYLGFAVSATGKPGADTHSALARFQAAAGLPQTGELDDATMAALRDRALRPPAIA